MKETTTRYLTYEEELLAAIYFNNVEKVKWLIDMDYFKASMVTEPVDFGEMRVPLYWLTICYHYMLRYGQYNDIRWQVDEILNIWKERFFLDTDELVDLKSCFKIEEMPPVVKDTDKWWMGHLTLEDFLQSGARKVDYDLYKAINAYDINRIVEQLRNGGIPNAKVIGKNNKPTSAISMMRFWVRNHINHYGWGKEQRVEKWQVSSLVREGLEEMILSILEHCISERTSTPVETFDGDVDMLGTARHKEKPNLSQEFIDKIDAFIIEIDKSGAVLALFDEGKVFARCEWLSYWQIYSYMCKKVFKSKHIRLRVGGYSYRVAQMVLHAIENLPKDRVYIEYLSEGDATSEYNNKDPRVKVIGMKKYDFKWKDEIVKIADEYDFKTYGNRKGTHTMVYYYANNIDTGWYNADGIFCNFYGKHRGLQAITDVIMIHGYKEIHPATAAAFTCTFDKESDVIMCGGTTHQDRRSRTSSQKKLIKDAGIECLDLTNYDAL